MQQIICISHVPDNVVIKAENLIDKREQFSKKRNGWKNITSLPGYFSVRLSNSYRALFSKKGVKIYVGDHDAYEKQIKKLKK